MQTVIETPNYIKEAEDAGLSKSDRESFVDFISENPMAGDKIPGTGGARKVRYAAKGKGKRGGVRVITFYSGTDIPVFLLSVFAKGEKINLSQNEKNEFRKALGEIAAEYKAER
jgi:hypothetical protein